MSLQTENIDTVTNYLHDNYYDDCERMAHIKMIQVYATYKEQLPDKWEEGIDKVALFNDIKKSYPPQKSTTRKIIEGIGFIMYGA